MCQAGVGAESRLGTAGRAARLVATTVVAVLITSGAIWGDDEAFPFGPFRMYSTRAGPEAPVNSTRVEGVDATGERRSVSSAATGLRRAEIEGQTPDFIADPELLGLVAVSYAGRNPDRPPLVRVEVINRAYELRNGLRTGAYEDEIIVVWTEDPP